jgi:signal transduction histidine kinase/CheY-like chemotaxis protein
MNVIPARFEYQGAAGETAPPRPSGGTRRHATGIEAERTRTLFRNAPLGTTAAAVTCWMLSIAMIVTGRLDLAAGLIWIALMGICLATHLKLCRDFRRAQPDDESCRIWLRRFIAVCALEGLVWCYGAIILFDPANFQQELVVLLVFSAVASGAVSVFGANIWSYSVFFFPTISPHLIFALIFSFPMHWLLAVLIGFYVAAMTSIVRNLNHQAVESLSVHFDNLELAEQLRTEKERAEEANIAKSRFLASASHDLRQPLHALSLFVGALEGRPLDSESRDILGNIADSVAAMDMLFASLLDISKLDAGVVTVDIQDIELTRVIERICRDFQGEAAMKGVTLRHHLPHSIMIRSDPVLVERIVRNLVSNAARYTDEGRVVVGIRRERGQNCVRVEVWDTGRGIPNAEAGNIFHEFYQLGNPERDRTKGLGLGLAIVKRMAALVDSPISVASTPGKGSVFKVSFPRGEERPRGADTVKPIVEGVLEPSLILVIDDEQAIREGTSRLLQSWGHSVVTAGSGAEMLELVAERSDRPDLIICDYRLRDNENGIAVIESLRMEYNEDLPAILVSGDTDPARLAEIEESGLLLLSKPVAPARLRTAIGSLLRAKLAR